MTRLRPRHAFPLPACCLAAAAHGQGTTETVDPVIEQNFLAIKNRLQQVMQTAIKKASGGGAR